MRIADLPANLKAIARDVRGMVNAHQALLLVGAPGSGKTLLARALAEGRRLPSGKAVVPQIAGIYRMAGLPWNGATMPFRAPHHTVSLKGMAGVGASFQPGELSLAHGGVLFLDEAAEFAPSVLRLVAKVYEDRVVEYGGKPLLHLQSLPADFCLIAACESGQEHRVQRALHCDLVVEVPSGRPIVIA